jgi:hypothetical protein
VSDYYQPLDPKPSQGDIIELAPHTRLFDPVSYVSRGPAGLAIGLGATKEAIAEARNMLAVILNPDCELDKASTRFWLIAPLHPLSLMIAHDQGNIRKNKVLKYLHVPPYPPLVPESFIDFGAITTIEAAIMKKTNRIVTLSDSARAALYVQQMRWFSRWVLNDVQCPKCQLRFNPTDTLPVRSV